MGKHWVPQHLLRGFSPDGSNVWMYDKRGVGSATLVAISKAAQSPKAYDAAVERLMESIETAASRAINQFRSTAQPIKMSDEAKLLISYYLAMFFWYRNPGFRSFQIKETKERVGREHLERMRRDWEGLPIRALIDQHESELLAGWQSHPNSIFANSWSPSVILRLLVSKMTWAILESPDAEFTITDATMIRSGRLHSESSSVYLPLCSRRVLLASWHGGPPDVVRLLRVDRRQVHLINKKGFMQADRFVFARVQSDRLGRAIIGARARADRPRGVRAISLPGENGNHSLRDWIIRNHDDLYDTLCLTSPRYSHDWLSPPIELPVISDMPDFKGLADRCRWCGTVRIRYGGGRVEYRNSEVDLVGARMNWWQTVELRTVVGRMDVVERSELDASGTSVA